MKLLIRIIPVACLSLIALAVISIFQASVSLGATTVHPLGFIGVLVTTGPTTCRGNNAIEKTAAVNNVDRRDDALLDFDD